MFKKYISISLFSLFLLFSSCSNKEPDPLSSSNIISAPHSSISNDQLLRMAGAIKYLSNGEILYISNTGSMIPALDSNTIVVLEQVDKIENLNIGDFISYIYINPNSKYNNLLILHKIIDINIQKDEILVQGLNNISPDPIIQFVQVQGRVFCILYGKEEIK